MAFSKGVEMVVESCLTIKTNLYFWFMSFRNRYSQSQHSHLGIVSRLLLLSAYQKHCKNTKKNKINTVTFFFLTQIGRYNDRFGLNFFSRKTRKAREEEVAKALTEYPRDCLSEGGNNSR